MYFTKVKQIGTKHLVLAQKIYKMPVYSIIPPPTCKLEGRNVILLAQCPVLGHKGYLVNVGQTDERMNEENAGLLVVVVDIFPRGGRPKFTWTSLCRGKRGKVVGR